MINGQTQKKIEVILGIAIFILASMVIVRAVTTMPMITNDNICILEHGENWRFESSQFGKTCIELDYVSLSIINRTPMIDITEAYKKYCDRPRFFDISKWGNGCVEVENNE